MPKGTSNTRRVMLAVTETSSLRSLWSAAMKHLAAEHAELITVFVRDDRWHRAASLPFTEEISRASGSSIDFTRQRAQEVGQDAIARAQGRLQQLAADSEIPLVFEILADQEATRIHEFVRSKSDLLIAPPFYKGHPFNRELTRLKCRILLVEPNNVTKGHED